MLGLVTYMLILTALSVGVWRQPTVGVAAVLCLYGLKQWGQSMTAFFSEHGQFTNFAVASIALVGLLRAASRRGCLFCRVPSTTVLVVVLYLYAFLSLTWAPDIYVSLEQWGSQGPYILTVALLAPLLFADFEDAQVAFTWTAMTGAVICMLALVFGKWGSRGLLLFNDTHEWETNPLALSSMAGTVFLIAALSFGQPKRLWMKVFSIVLIPVSIAVILRSGSRGQLIASGVGLMAALPIAFRFRDARSIGMLVVVAVLVVGLGWGSTSIVEVDADRWGNGKQSQDDVAGRVENAEALLQASSSSFSTTVFGLSNSSSFHFIGFYPHIASLEVIAEEGLLGASVYLSILILALRSIKRIAGQPDLEGPKRNVLAVLTGLFVFELVLSQKQGSLLSCVYVFGYAIALARLEEPIFRQAPADTAATPSPRAVPRYHNLLH